MILSLHGTWEDFYPFFAQSADNMNS